MNSSAAPAMNNVTPYNAAEVAPQDARILLIDDHAPTVSTVKALLAKDGYAAIQTTTDPEEAARLFATLRPDVVILDVAMPGVDGFTVLERLQAQANQGFATIFLTGSDTRDIRVEAYRRGAVDFVIKPIDQTELRLRVRNQARAITAARALAAQNARLSEEIANRTARLEDATDVLRVAEARLSETLLGAETKSQEKMAFFASVNHELRTPLNAISGFAEVLKEQVFGPLGDAKYAEYARDIHDAATYLRRLINDVLDLSRAEATDFALDVRPVDPAAAVRAGLIMVEDQAKRAGVTLAVDIEPGLPIILTDEERLKQIVLNLTTNAIKFTPSGGRVTVKVRKDGDGVLILAISDTGIGIATEDLPTVMKPFGQVRRIRSKPTNIADKGTGLGLPITKRLAELMGGRLEIKSEPGVGTVVTIRLPLEPA
jgi:two-component system, cell cycle sensor histidine kinase PleC